MDIAATRRADPYYRDPTGEIREAYWTEAPRGQVHGQRDHQVARVARHPAPTVQEHDGRVRAGAKGRRVWQPHVPGLVGEGAVRECEDRPKRRR